MLCLVFISVVTITLSGIYSEHVVKARSIEYDQEDLQCEAHCRQYRKHCANPPYLCGGCLDGHIERGGVCRPPDQEREITDEDIDTLIDEYRKLKQKTQEELAKDVLEQRNVDDNIVTEESPTESPHHESQIADNPDDDTSYTLNDTIFAAVVAGCSVAGLVGLVVAGVCWYRLQKNVKAASEVEYPAYGITGPTKETVGSPGDRKLAQSAQMYHYQHQKQQMIALEKANGEMKQEGSEDDSDEENEEGDYTVYECPGLAPTGEMEVKNPLFNEETPVTPTPDDRRDMK